ncbi:hypothetical protein G3I60_28520 [Streptomyces sp. SID13666]|uniref:hypothetical protein n=1 Tax=unclassified Streptomyces TaxID=2593676 RepID=UPI0013BFAD7B|nr:MULTISPECIES: hypothetical protein [unclassified Streptomyces]NEA57997.1 hypothetical protein [Streptomyces sp. SID13666]NEA72856.1 hypothetical protein [Streptomyces sp. SID13588]
MERAPNLRMIALTSVIALAVVLPLAAATAGPSGPAGPPARAARSDRPQSVPGVADGTGAGTVDGLLPGLGPASGGSSAAGNAPGPSGGSAAGPGAGSAALRPVAACGPQLTSPEGVQAQTCTIAVGGDTWARTYYRNGTGGPLGGVLTLMRPDGRTVRVECPVGAGNGPGSCETPRERTVKAVSPDDGTAEIYSAVAEFASAGSERMLLRAGSNR